MKSIYKIPIYDIHNLIVSLTELFFIDYEETCTIYMNYYKNYKDYYDNPSTQTRHIGLCSLHNMYIKEYISTNNINYNILSIIVNHYNIIYSSRNTDITNFDYTDKNLEKDIESFLKPFKIFINYINKTTDIQIIELQ
jgi:hypothetical protein